MNQMASKFVEPGRILVHERCKFLRLTLRSGTFNSNRTDFIRTSALGHCDAAAALMYALRLQNKLNPFAAAQMPGGLRYDDATSFQPARPVSYLPMGPKKFGSYK